MRLTQPVPDLGRVALHVLLEEEPDAAGRFAVDLDGELGLWLGDEDLADPRLGVGQGVGMGEAVADVEPDLAAVGVLRQRGLVARAPAPDAATGDLELHLT